MAAIEAASSGDTVLVSPGVFHERIRIKGKQITLASRFLQSRDEHAIKATILDGRIRQADGSVEKADAVIKVAGDAGPGTRIIGFSIQNGDDGISCEARIEHKLERCTEEVPELLPIGPRHTVRCWLHQ